MHIAQSKVKFSAVITSIPQIGQKGSTIPLFFDFFAELVLKQSIYQHFCNLKDEIFMHYLSKSNLVELKKPYKNFDMYDIGKVEKLIVEMERIW